MSDTVACLKVLGRVTGFVLLILMYAIGWVITALNFTNDLDDIPSKIIAMLYLLGHLFGVAYFLIWAWM